MDILPFGYIHALSLDAAQSELRQQLLAVYIGWKSMDNYDAFASDFKFYLMALCHSQITLMLCTDINITGTTYSCQFQYVFGNQ